MPKNVLPTIQENKTDKYNLPVIRKRKQRELTYTFVRPEPYEVEQDKFIREIAKFVNLLI